MSNQSNNRSNNVPLLRYPGGKFRISNWIIDAFPPHSVYVEPFAGSAAVFLCKQRSPIEALNDMDDELINFFKVLRNRPEELIWQISYTPWSQEEHKQSKEKCDECDELERARRFYVSIWQTFAMRFDDRSWTHQVKDEDRPNWTDIWRRKEGLLSAANRLMDAQISKMPAIDCIVHYDSEETLYYLDPPYVLSSRADKSRKRYRHEMTDNDHIELADCLHSVKGKVILSGYASDLYDKLYADWQRITKRSTVNHTTRSVEEVLWLSPSATNIEKLPLFSGS